MTPIDWADAIMAVLADKQVQVSSNSKWCPVNGGSRAVVAQILSYPRDSLFRVKPEPEVTWIALRDDGYVSPATTIRSQAINFVGGIKTATHLIRIERDRDTNNVSAFVEKL